METFWGLHCRYNLVLPAQKLHLITLICCWYLYASPLTWHASGQPLLFWPPSSWSTSEPELVLMNQCRLHVKHHFDFKILNLLSIASPHLFDDLRHARELLNSGFLTRGEFNCFPLCPIDKPLKVCWNLSDVYPFLQNISQNLTLKYNLNLKTPSFWLWLLMSSLVQNTLKHFATLDIMQIKLLCFSPSVACCNAVSLDSCVLWPHLIHAIQDRPIYPHLAYISLIMTFRVGTLR